MMNSNWQEIFKKLDRVIKEGEAAQDDIDKELSMLDFWEVVKEIEELERIELECMPRWYNMATFKVECTYQEYLEARSIYLREVKNLKL